MTQAVAEGNGAAGGGDGQGLAAAVVEDIHGMHLPG